MWGKKWCFVKIYISLVKYYDEREKKMWIYCLCESRVECKKWQMKHNGSGINAVKKWNIQTTEVLICINVHEEAAEKMSLCMATKSKDSSRKPLPRRTLNNIKHNSPNHNTKTWGNASWIEMLFLHWLHIPRWYGYAAMSWLNRTVKKCLYKCWLYVWWVTMGKSCK